LTPASISAKAPGPGRLTHLAQVGAGGKGAGHAAGLVADDQADTVGIHIVVGFFEKFDDLVIERVHLGMELGAEDAVAQVDQGGRIIAHEPPCCRP
jgi:hypothetical protein